MKDFKKHNIKDFDTIQLQSNVADFLLQLTYNPLLDGRLVENVAVSTTAVAVNHGLGRAIRGYILVKATAGVTLFDTASVTPTTTVQITASASATVSLYIF